MPSQSPRTVSCPTCKREIDWSDKNQYRPFCSKRCKLIDFGEWATGKHAIAGEALMEGDLSEDELKHLLED